ncbi:hypothetical protein [Kribbella solani]|uniref:Uncharacterized protein n=1 Tax=Kribbella solani TaxID=236067 RepID=A0A841DU88_9ACTN|nr:hypothetical protein [Kribbella solani]MBB5981639.1 hypothetical protein [Kribbella solani]
MRAWLGVPRRGWRWGAELARQPTPVGWRRREDDVGVGTVSVQEVEEGGGAFWVTEVC